MVPYNTHRRWQIAVGLLLIAWIAFVSLATGYIMTRKTPVKCAEKIRHIKAPALSLQDGIWMVERTVGDQ